MSPNQGLVLRILSKGTTDPKPQQAALAPLEMPLFTVTVKEVYGA